MGWVERVFPTFFVMPLRRNSGRGLDRAAGEEDGIGPHREAAPALRRRLHDLDARDVPVLVTQVGHLAVREEPRPGPFGARQVGALHRLLGSRRELAAAAALAARDLGVAPAQPFDAFAEAARALRDLVTQARHRQVGLQAVEVGLHDGGREVGEHDVGVPAAVGVGRQAMPEAAVDLGRAAHAATLDERDRLPAEHRSHAAVPIEEGDRLRSSWRRCARCRRRDPLRGSAPRGPLRRAPPR